MFATHINSNKNIISFRWNKHIEWKSIENWRYYIGFSLKNIVKMKFMNNFRDEQHECFGICIARLCEYEFNFKLTERKWEKKKHGPNLQLKCTKVNNLIIKLHKAKTLKNIQSFISKVNFFNFSLFLFQSCFKCVLVCIRIR